MQSCTTTLSSTSISALLPLFQKVVLPSLYRAPEPEITCGRRKSRPAKCTETNWSCGSNRAITVCPSGQRKLSQFCCVSTLVTEQLNIAARTTAANPTLVTTFIVLKMRTYYFYFRQSRVRFHLR